MQTKSLRNLFIPLTLSLALLIGALGALQTQAQEPTGRQPQADAAFTYQGRLTQGTTPYSGTCSFDFKLYDAASGGAQIGSTNSKTGVAVQNGYFNVELFFGNTAFQGDDRYLDITVNCGGGAVTLTPRAKLTRAPQAQYASEAGSVEWSAVNNPPTFVESAGTGLSLSGVTMSITPAYRLPQSCANGQIAEWDGSVWTCANDTDTTYAAGTGIILNSGVFSIASSYRLPQACSDNQLTYWNDSASTWQCVNPGAASWSLTGNSGTSYGNNFIGTTDNVSFTIKTGGRAVMRFTPGNPPNIVGGYDGNVISGATGSVIGGGGASSWYGGPNYIEGVDADFTVIAGGAGNAISSTAADFDGTYAVIGGGYKNVISGDTWGNGNNSVIGGGYQNRNHGGNAVIGGGAVNSIISNDGCFYCGDSSVIGGGEDNRIWGYSNGMARFSTIGGGHGNVISAGHHAVIAGGYQNIIQGSEGWGIPPVGGSNAIGGGYRNLISATNYSTIGGGKGNVISETNYSTIPGGYSNTITSDYSFAAGYQAHAAHQGSFVWSDSFGGGVTSQRDNQFLVDAYGGARFQDGSTPGVWVEMVWDVTKPISTSTSAYLSSGGIWTDSSDRALKENFTPVDGQEILSLLSELPLSTWNYKTEDDSVRHLGPMAQDFYASFELGLDDKHIAALDSSGVALVAIQTLYQTVQEQDARIETLEAENNALHATGGDAAWVKPDMLQFTPQSGAPTTCNASTKGAMAYADGDNQFCFCNGADWKQVYSFATDCTW